MLKYKDINTNFLLKYKEINAGFFAKIQRFQYSAGPHSSKVCFVSYFFFIYAIICVDIFHFTKKK